MPSGSTIMLATLQYERNGLARVARLNAEPAAPLEEIHKIAGQLVMINRGAKVRMMEVTPNMTKKMTRRLVMPMRFLGKKSSRGQLYIYQRQSKLLQTNKGESVPCKFKGVKHNQCFLPT